MAVKLTRWLVDCNAWDVAVVSEVLLLDDDLA
jgi:hypothetical protein